MARSRDVIVAISAGVATLWIGLIGTSVLLHELRVRPQIEKTQGLQRQHFPQFLSDMKALQSYSEFAIKTLEATDPNRAITASLETSIRDKAVDQLDRDLSIYMAVDRALRPHLKVQVESESLLTVLKAGSNWMALGSFLSADLGKRSATEPQVEAKNPRMERSLKANLELFFTASEVSHPQTEPPETELTELQLNPIDLLTATKIRLLQGLVENRAESALRSVALVSAWIYFSGCEACPRTALAMSNLSLQAVTEYKRRGLLRNEVSLGNLVWTQDSEHHQAAIRAMHGLRAFSRPLTPADLAQEFRQTLFQTGRGKLDFIQQCYCTEISHQVELDQDFGSTLSGSALSGTYIAELEEFQALRSALSAACGTSAIRQSALTADRRERQNSVHILDLIPVFATLTALKRELTTESHLFLYNTRTKTK